MVDFDLPFGTSGLDFNDDYRHLPYVAILPYSDETSRACQETGEYPAVG